MSYGYYKQTSRGRGFSSRGTYRGRGGGGDSGFYNSRGTYRGRSTWQTDRSSTGFDSRSRYTTGVSSRGQVDDSGYRRYVREDEGDYSTHDRSYHRSPESSRKRMRSDHGYTQASSARRTHDTGYEGGADYSNRYSYSDEKESYGYREERRSTGGFRDRSRDDYSLRKQEPLEVSMPPPSGSSRYMPSVRGSYRGRIRTRGFRGMSKMPLGRRTSTFLARKRSLVDPNAVRKRIVSARTQADTLRRLRILKLRRLRETALLRRAAAAGKKEGKAKEDSSKATEDISDEEEEEEDDEEEEVEDGTEKDGKADDGKVLKKKKKIKTEDGDKQEKDVKEGEEKEGDEEMDEDGEAEDDEEEDEDDDKSKTEAASNGDVDGKGESAEEGEDAPVRSSLFRGRPFIKLNCPHCYTRCITFQEYNSHLYSFKHINAVRKLWRLHKTVLTQLRMRQRQKQRIIDKKKEEGEGVLKTKYCIVCKLNYGDMKAEHVASEYHKKILDFMKPYCRICKFKLNSPMLYEKHLCSLDHIKRKALLVADKELLKDSASGGEEDEGKELDLDNFMTLDSVGTFDDAGDESKKEGDDKAKTEEEKKSKPEVKLGEEHIKQVNVQYCELCHMYLSRSEESEKSLTMHCRSRTHLAFYMRHRRRQERKEAEERQIKLLAKKKAKSEAAKKASEDNEASEEKMDTDKEAATKTDSVEEGEGSPSKEKSSQSPNKAADVSLDASGELHEGDQDLETDEKMWADVDKDLGDILREVGPDNKSSDEDEDGTEVGRYDRFKYSEKGSTTEEGKVAKEGDDPPVETEVDEDQAAKAPDDPKASISPVKKTAAAPAPTTATAAVNSK